MNKEKLVKSLIISVFFFLLFAKNGVFAAVPTCVSWTSINVNGCTSAGWASTPRKDVCKTVIQNPENVTLNLSSVGATTMSFAVVSTTAACPALTSPSYIDSRNYATSTTLTIPPAKAAVGGKKICVKFTNASGSKACFGNIQIVNPPTPTRIPSPTPIPEEALVPPAIGTKAYCSSISASQSELSPNQSLTITSTANVNTIKTFTYRFFNKDHIVSKQPAAIRFKPAKNYTWTVKKSPATNVTNSNTITLNFAQFDRPDRAWKYYMPKPKNILVRAYFTDSLNRNSNTSPLCEISIKVNSIDPTPTPNPGCKCIISTGKCSTACFHDKFLATVGFTYANPVKCNLDGSLFSTVPTADQKNAWCRSYYKTKGDANNDGKTDLMDYFYYVSAKSGQKVPATVNVDFDGNGSIADWSDRGVIMRSLKR